MEEDQGYPEEDLEDDETGYSLYVEQDDLEIVREWFEEIRVDRIDEANRLEVELAQAERDIREFLEELENVDAWKSERGHIEWTNGEVRERRINVERYYRMLRDKRDFAQTNYNEP